MWLDATNRLEEIAALNEASDYNKIGVIQREDGTLVVPGWLLDEAGEGEAWEAFGDFLRSLPPATPESE